jgi:hypothetical protein
MNKFFKYFLLSIIQLIGIVFSVIGLFLSTGLIIFYVLILLNGYFFGYWVYEMIKESER